MSSFTLLQPHLLTTEQLRDHLKAVHRDKIQFIVFLFCVFVEIKINADLMILCSILQRFPNRNLSTLSRDELLKLFSLYAIPKARRNTPNTDVEMTPVHTNVIQQEQNGHKRSRHQMITAPTVETVTNACKKIRLFSTAAATQKRPCQLPPMVRL